MRSKRNGSFLVLQRFKCSPLGTDQIQSQALEVQRIAHRKIRRNADPSQRDFVGFFGLGDKQAPTCIKQHFSLRCVATSTCRAGELALQARVRRNRFV